jgi:hypothetical protein
MPLSSVRRLTALALMASPGLAVAADPEASLANFPTAQEAQQHCPDDLIVWLDLPTRTYHTGASAGTARPKTAPTSAATRPRRRRCEPHEAVIERAPKKVGRSQC